MLPGEDPQDEFRLLLRLQGGRDNHIDTRLQMEVMSHFTLINEDLVLVHRLMSGEESWGQLSVAFLVLLKEETEQKCVLHQLNKQMKDTWRIHRHGTETACLCTSDFFTAQADNRAQRTQSPPRAQQFSPRTAPAQY